MSLTTRCPACETVFKVVPDQLRIASGWVRCGQCGAVFDGAAQLLDADPSAATAPPAVVPEPAHAADAQTRREPELEHGLAPGLAASPPQPQVPAGAEPGPAGDADADVAPGIEPAPEARADWTAEAAVPMARRFAQLEQDLLINPPTPVLRAEGEPTWDAADTDTASGRSADPDWREPDAASDPGASADAAPSAPADPLTPAVEAPAVQDAAADVPSFVAQSRRRARWQSRPVRSLLWIALLLLALGLLGQWAVQQRDWLAARHPFLRPVLQTLCRPLQCQLAPYRRLEAIVIDGSGFNRIDAERFRFTVTLHNNADLPVATPALELALTDVAGQVLVRRVLQPEEFGAPPALAPQGEFDGTRELTVAAEARPQAIVNYRVTAFYP